MCKKLTMTPRANIQALLDKTGARLAHFPPNPDSPSGSRGLTVAYYPRQSDKHVLEFATAITSENDTFEKHTGAELALTRLREDKTAMLPPVLAYRRPLSDYEILRAHFG